MSRERAENQRRLAEISQIEKNTGSEPRWLTGAGSFQGGLIGQPENRPSSARDRIAHAERGQFVFDTSVKPLADKIATLTAGIEKNEIESLKLLSKLVVGDDPWEAKESFGPEAASALFRGITRGDANDATASNASRESFKAAFGAFSDSEVYAVWRRAPMQLQAQVVEILLGIMERQHISTLVPGNFAAVLAICENAGFVLPALPQTASAPVAEDGNPIAVNDRTGEPVVYEGKAYSQKMLDALPSSQFEKVLGLRETSAQRYAREEREEEQRRDRETSYSGTQIVFANGRGFTQKELDAMPAEEYRRTMGLRRHDSATLVQQLLQAGGGLR